MAANSKIEWCDHTVNFWIGCTKVSPACDHCYAERDWAMTGRHQRVEWGPHGARSPTKDPLAQVRKIAAGAARRGHRERIFINSLSDWADNHKSIAPEWRAQIFEAARLYPGLDFLLLTKRPQNIASFLPADWGAGYTNVWLGTTVENQEEADRRIPHLLATPAAVRFVSAEPLLSRVDFERIAHPQIKYKDSIHYVDVLRGGFWSPKPFFRASQDGEPKIFFTNHGDMKNALINWVIVGGESGAGARPMQVDWARSIVEQCRSAGVACFVKQLSSGGPNPIKDMAHFPHDLRVREMPTPAAP